MQSFLKTVASLQLSPWTSSCLLTTDDTSKNFFLIDQEDTASIRDTGRDEHPVKGSFAAHILIFMPTGTISLRNTINGTEELVNLNFTSDNNQEIPDDDEDDIEDQLQTLDHFSTSAIFSLITEGTYIAIKSPVGSLELFFIMKVVKKGIAIENMSDSANEHFVLKGETYLVGKWFSFQHEGEKMPNTRKQRVWKML